MTKRAPAYTHLYFQVLVGIVLGVLVGYLWPATGAALRPLGVLHIGLNVFADHPFAQRLYARQGYTITNYSMQKRL